MSNVRHFGAKGDGQTDDTAALSHALQQGDGRLRLPRGDYVISRPLFVPLDVHGRACIEGLGGTAKLIMTGPGPAIHIVGTHARNADPRNVAEPVWRKERLPMVRDLEIEGRHPEADGLRIEGAMQPTLTGLLIRRCRHGIHLTKLNRNVLIADCHVYDNSGVGIFLERLNLHQVNIHGSHISYCKQGGIKVVASEIRNIQICSNDIEYNYDEKAEESADIHFDCRQGSIREGTIVGNTIQARPSPGGANIRLEGAGKGNANAVGMIAISGNLIGSQRTNIQLDHCRGVVVSGNCIYNGAQNALFALHCEHLVIGANSIDHNPDYKGKATDRLIFSGCRNVTLSGLAVQHTHDPEFEPEATLEVHDCRNFSMTGCQLLNVRRLGVAVRKSATVRIADCTIRGRLGDFGYLAAVNVDAASGEVMVVNNFVAKGREGDVQLPKEAGSAAGNVTVAPR